MNRLQEAIVKFVSQNSEYHAPQAEKDGTTVSCFHHGRKRRLTANIFLDVMDADTKQIIAESDIPHSIEAEYRTPVSWKIIEQGARA